ncbi:MAG: Nucleoporin nup84 [Chrysothrix sp. TS-e1954]|nr:MAG: Nucleoporin nup84 [Chrysothrix sp. TS-e1954]
MQRNASAPTFGNIDDGRFSIPKLETSRAFSSMSHTAMEVDDDSMFARSADQALFPLREMADRVGNEVEKFAEKLDGFRPHGMLEQETDTDTSLDLVREYKSIAFETVDKLRKTHGAEQKRRLRSAWNGNDQATKNATQQPSEPTSPDADDAYTTASTTLRDLQYWQNEYNTWSLVHELVQFRHKTPSSSPSTGDVGDNGRLDADGEIFNNCLLSNPSFKEKHIVVKWLEDCAEQTGNDIGVIEEQLEERSGRGPGLWSQGWIDTRERIKAQKRLRLWDKPVDSKLLDITSSTGPDQLVTQLDLDAVTRMKGNLEHPDLTFEKSFWTMCWEMLRRGVSMEELKDWCEEHHGHVRAAMMGAYAGLEDQQNATAKAVVRYRWRKACCEAARHGGLNHYERAVLGLLGGNLESVDRIALTWEDHLHAHYNASLLQQYSEYVINRCTDKLPPKDLYKFGKPASTSSRTDLNGYVRSIMSMLYDDNDTDLPARQPLKILQSKLMTNELEDLLVREGVEIARRGSKVEGEGMMPLIPRPTDQVPADETKLQPMTDDPNVLRVFAHVVLLFRHVGLKFGSESGREAAENIVISYMEFLLLAGKMDLLPLYASFLSPTRAAPTMARILSSITNPSQRIEYVRLMQDFGMDVIDILATQLELCLGFSGLFDQESNDDFRPFKLLETPRVKDAEKDMWPGKRVSRINQQPLRAEYETIVQSLEWFLLVDGYWFQTFAALTDVAKRFLLYGHVNAASELLQRLPPREVSLAKTPSVIGRRCDISDYEMTLGSAPGSPGASQSPPGLTQSNMSTSFGLINSGELADVDFSGTVNLRQAMKVESKSYYEIGQMLNIINVLWSWREVEDWRLQLQNEEELGRALQDGHQISDSLKQAMSLLETDFLTTPSLGIDSQDGANARSFHDVEVEQLRRIREAYLPEVVLAYHSALVCSGFLESRTRELDALEVASQVANNQELSRCFQATGRVRELVTALALGSRALLRLNESKGTSRKKGKSMGRQRDRVLSIWNITG